MKTNFKKIIPYLLTLVLFMGIGLFGVAQKANAASPDGKGTCWDPNTTPKTETNLTEEQCGLNGASKITGKKAFEWIPTGAQNPTAPLTAYDKCMQEGGDTSRCGDLSGAPSKSPKTPFETAVEGQACISLTEFDMGGCVVKFTYYAFFLPASFLLWLSAQFFNVLISITLYSGLFKDSGFIPEAWGVVRDISNIFFLIILLFTALQIILDIGHGGAKKTITWVIIMALLINFSMFFTKVVIDTSNVIALVFYNKMKVTTKDASQQERNYNSISTREEKDISGSMVNSFNPTKLLSEEFFKEAGKQKHPGSDTVIQGEPSFGIMIGLIIISVAIMIFASYAFFVAGLSFLGRMIELFILIIFSPFAFMSFALPALSGFEYFGWSAWIKRLIKASFMAPIFMFFMYFIFMLIDGGVTKDLLKVNQGEQSFIGLLLLILIPALLILILLLKATEFAKKGSGALGEKLVSYGKAALGIGLGAATGGMALGAMGAIGKASSMVAEKEGLKDAAKEKGMKGWAAKMALKTANAGATSSFDFRNTGLGKKFAGATGINMSGNMPGFLRPKEGGFEGMVKRGAEKREKQLTRESALLKTKKSNDEVKEEYAKKQETYDKDKKKAMGEGMSEADFEKKYGKRPVAYQTAEELNHARIKKFKENIGDSGLIASLAHSLTKKVTEENLKESKEYKNWQKEKEEAKTKPGFNEEEFNKAHLEPTVESVNRDRVKNTKLIIGSAAAAVGVASGGAAFAGMGGLAAGAIAGTTAKTILGKLGESITHAQAKGEKDFIKKEEKHEKKMKALELQIESMKSKLKNYTTVMENFEKEGITKNTGKIDEHKNKIYEVDIEKLSEKIATETATIKSLESELVALNNRTVASGSNSNIEERKKAINTELNSTAVRLSKLELLKDVDKRATDIRIQISKTDDKKHQVEHEHEEKEEKMLKKDSKGGGENKKEEKHDAHPEPEKGGGGDHGGGEKHEGGGEKHGH